MGLVEEMNERMTELWKQSWVKIHPDDPINERFDEEKFAELIVKECIRKIGRAHV